jgi:O-antigen/teichoic acid export membrane protein
VAAVGFPIVCIQWAIAPLFIGTIYSDKWQGAVTAFRLISIYGMGRAVCQPGTTLISATGRPEIAFRLSALTCPVLVTAVAIGRMYGINGVALATALAHGTFVWFYIIIPFRCLGWNPMDAARVMFAPFTCALLAGLLCAGLYGLMGHPTCSLAALGLLLVAGGLAYLGSYRLFFPMVGSELMGVLRSTVREVRS